MTIPATELLAAGEVDDFTKFILEFVEVLDEKGAQTWDLRLVGAATTASLLVVRLIFAKRGGIDWYALLHALVSGLGSVMAVYLDVVSTEALTGTPEPLRSCLCGGPLTSLHRILPAITMGYALFDILDGISLGLEFMLHGIATFIIMAFFVESDLPQIVAPFLLMEVSTIFLAMIRATIFPEFLTVLVQLGFAANFFLFRILITPVVWLRLMIIMYQHHEEDLYKSCFNPFVLPVSIFVGLFFHMLNAFWFSKIIKKAQRKLKGEEKFKANNDLKEFVNGAAGKRD